ncbi:hypothetical protein DLJ53_03805 [Acuticoccus sediminis]|uniref:Uncharacterized protein n=1 Tax=Acuticoccus sediminis TaxID=2184697 RepID=A0A8B2P3B2_9HYPH|nr:hypothetical protein [Acuticoccus sediminis]RAI03622.1 hypothetical protein DLJ53_03805 [Acuticoccus sediminis]
MTKIISAIIALAILAHLIRPLGLPGLKRRSDAWKLVIVAFALLAGVILLRPEPSAETLGRAPAHAPVRAS